VMRYYFPAHLRDDMVKALREAAGRRGGP
jgi:hypothetical protein